MVKIIIENLAQKELLVTDVTRSALQVFQDHHLDWMQECGGKGRCTTCKMIVNEGLEGLPELTPAERSYRQQGLLATNERLACQVKVVHSISIIVPESSKLKHLHYT